MYRYEFRIALTQAALCCAHKLSEKNQEPFKKGDFTGYMFLHVVCCLFVIHV